jgi:spore coat polysaccharide biosynthesis protein SpsF
MNLAILQARMSSSRLPGKVLKPLANAPMLIQQAHRILRCKNIDKLVVATSLNEDDDTIEAICLQYKIDCFRGSLNNVLSRFVAIADKENARHIIRLTADCPLTDPDIIDQAISTHIQGNFDYTSNCNPRTYPDGLDVEVLTYQTLMTINTHSQSNEEFEHVTTYIDNHLHDFSIGNIEQTPDLSELRWTVDLPEDYAFASNIYDALFPNNNAFTQQDILDYCKKGKNI